MPCLLAAGGASCRRGCGKKGEKRLCGEWLPRKFEAQIAVSVGLGVAICMLWPKLQILATCTCALMCAQAGTAQSVRLGLLRLRGILLCGLTGVLIVFLHGLMGQAPLAYIPLAMAGTLLSLVLCRVCGMAPMDSRVGCITYLLVIVATGRYSNTVYALWRFFSSLVGCLLAAGVSGLFHLGRRS